MSCGGRRPKEHPQAATQELNLSFKHSRFVGYAYSANADGPARQRHGALLATARGLALGDTVARARHLYTRAFIETSVPQGTPPSAKLPRLPVGEVSTASGEISAAVVSELELNGYVIQRVYEHGRLVGVRLLEPEPAVTSSAPRWRR
jgi:hypothetical protein